MTIIKEISNSMRNVLEIFFGSDTEVMSSQVKEIMANPEDKKKYLEALGKLRKLEENGEHGTEKLKLSNNKELELTV